MEQINNRLFKEKDSFCLVLSINSRETRSSGKGASLFASIDFQINQLQEPLEGFLDKISSFDSVCFGKFFFFRFSDFSQNVGFLANNGNKVYLKGVFFDVLVSSIPIDQLKAHLFKENTNKKKQKIESKLETFLHDNTFRLIKQENDSFSLEAVSANGNMTQRKN